MGKERKNESKKTRVGKDFDCSVLELVKGFARAPLCYVVLPQYVIVHPVLREMPRKVVLGLNAL